MKKQTQATKAKEIIRKWHVIDVKDKILGRATTEIALLLMGKAKPYFVRHLDCGDYVVVVNAKDVQVTGKKETKKLYKNYSGYPGGLKTETYEKLHKRKPEEIIIHAVRGMLPQTRLRDTMLTRLFVFAEDKHPYEDKLKVQNPKLKEKKEIEEK